MTKDELIEKHRYWNVEHQWWDHVYSSFAEDMKDKYGLEIATEHMRFSGFCSQGDGASFITGLSQEELLPFLEGSEIISKHPLMRVLLEMPDVEIEWRMHRHRDNYCHEHTVEGVLDLTSFTRYGDDEVTHAMAEAVDQKFNPVVEACEKDIIDFLRDQMRELYSQLEEEYEHLISDEAVWEALVANDMDKELEEAEE